MNKGIEDVIASDNEAIQTKPQMRSPSLDCFALLATTDSALVLTDAQPRHRVRNRSAAIPTGPPERC